MAWLAVDKDGLEGVFQNIPRRKQLDHKYERWVSEERFICLPNGTIKLILGYELTWNDEPVEIKEE